MLFTISAKALIQDKETEKYYVKTIEAVDYHHFKIYTENFLEDQKGNSFNSYDCIIKPYLINYKGLEIYSGDILEIKKGKHAHKYEVHVLDGEVLFRNINNNIEIGFDSIKDKPNVDITILPYHYNKEREMIELSE